MNQAAILGLVRHVLTFGGGFFVQQGWLSGDDATVAVSSIVALAGIVWSAIDKKGR